MKCLLSEETTKLTEGMMSTPNRDGKPWPNGASLHGAAIAVQLETMLAENTLGIQDIKNTIIISI